MSRPAAAPIVLLAVLAVAGGCSGLETSPSEPSAPTVPPAPVPEGPPSTGAGAGTGVDAADGPLPPGVEREAGLETLVRVRMRYERMGSAEVSPPPWYDAARWATGGADANATGAGDGSENGTPTPAGGRDEP